MKTSTLSLPFLLFGIIVTMSLSCTKSGPKKTVAPPPEPRPELVGRPETPPAPSPVRPFNPFPASRGVVVDTLHGKQVADPYRTLEDLSLPATREWVTKQNEYARKFLGELPDRQEMGKRLAELNYMEWVSPPKRKGKRYFFVRRHLDREKVVYYWQEGQRGAPKILLDPNTLSTDGTVAIRGVFPSHDGKTVAYLKSLNNADHATLHVMDVASGKVSAIDVIDGARYAQPSWDEQGTGFYYTRIPMDPAIPAMDLPGHAAVYYHKLGSDPKSDRLVREKTGDPRTFVGAEVSRDGRWLVLAIQFGWTNVDLYFQDLSEKSPQWRPLAVGRGAMHLIEMHKGFFYISTNSGAPNYRVFRVDPKTPDVGDWKEIIPEQKDRVLDGISIVGGRLALSYLHRASSVIELANLEGKDRRAIALPGIGTTPGLQGHPDDDRAFYTFSSFTSPPIVYETSVKKGGNKVFFEVKLPFDPAPFTTTQVTYKSKDGTPVTMFLIHRKDLKPDGRTPFMLYGYGGFNISLTPAFSPHPHGVARERRRHRHPQPARRRGVRRGLAPGRHAADQAEHLRRLHRRGAVPGRPEVHRTGQAGDPGRLQRRPARGRGHGAAPRPLPRGGLSRAAAGHGPLPPVRLGQDLDLRVRLR
jgi:prolyl oligopeptidase